MPWQKSFDEETALEKGVQLFWRKGFEPASIADLLEEAGLNRGSLYNAFGGKQQLFVQALLKYERDIRRAKLAQLEALNNPKEVIVMFSDAIVVEAVADRDHKGCFLVNTASEIAKHDEEVNEIVTNGVSEIEAFFRRCIEMGRARGDMPKVIDPEGTAKTQLALIVAIRVLGSGVFAEVAFHTITDAGKILIL